MLSIETLTWDHRQVKNTIPIFEQMYLNAITEFVFDQLSVAHGVFTKDAVNAKEINIRSGGKERKMHNTTISMNNLNLSLCGMPQAMVFSINLSPEHPDHAFHGQLKGMQQVLEECGLLSVLEWVNSSCVKHKSGLSMRQQQQLRRLMM